MPWLIGFLVAVQASSGSASEAVSPRALQVEILRYSAERSLTNHNPVVIRFSNRQNSMARIVRPFDGSEWSWHMPYYRFTVTDSSGKPLDLTSRCGASGLWANIKWPDDYVIPILPGDSYEMQVGIPHFVPADGQYDVKFEYVYEPDIPTKSGIKYSGNLWSGKAASKGITVSLRKSL